MPHPGTITLEPEGSVTLEMNEWRLESIEKPPPDVDGH
jgi:hypothetical protein